jgi:hypothetical protein
MLCGFGGTVAAPPRIRRHLNRPGRVVPSRDDTQAHVQLAADSGVLSDSGGTLAPAPDPAAFSAAPGVSSLERTTHPKLAGGGRDGGDDATARLGVSGS